MKYSQVFFHFCLLIALASAAIVGLDFGQEYSKSVLVAPGVPFEMLLTSDSKRKDVSGLALKQLPNGDLERLYGSSSLSHCIKSPSTCLLHLKLLLGKSVEDPEVVEYLGVHKGVSLQLAKGSRNTIAFDMAKLGVFPVEELFAMSLVDVKNRAQLHLRHSIAAKYSAKDIVITVPAFFNQAQRLAVMDGAEIAGFNVVALVDDGVAVAVNYVSSRQYSPEKQYHIVYDMGAGSTKATLFSVMANETTGGQVVEIAGVGFQDRLGGELLTKSVRDILIDKFLDKNAKKVSSKAFYNNERAMAKIWQAAEKAKLILSANTEASVSVESLFNDLDFKATICRDEFQEYNADIMAKVTQPILDIFDSPLMSDLALTLADIESVILTGGSTRVPFVQKHLTSLVGEDKLAKNVNADESAVLGATLRGVILSNMFKAKDIQVVDRSPVNFVAVVGSETVPVFPRGSPSGDKVEIDLTSEIDQKSDQFTVDLYEDGQLFQTHTFSGLKDAVKSLSSPSDFKIVASFQLSHSRIFTLDKVEVKATPVKKGIIGKLFNKDDEEELDLDLDLLADLATELNLDLLADLTTELDLDQVPLENDDSEDSNASGKGKNGKSKSKSGKKKVVLSGKKSYAKQHPMSLYSKQSSMDKLQNLAVKDSARRKRDHAINELESSLYSLRSYLETESESGEESAGLVEKASNLASEYLEWLDYDSDAADIKEINEKLEEVQILHLKLIAYSEFLVEGKSPLNQLHKAALELMHGIQDFMLTMAEDASSLRTNFTAIGLDWELENKKIKISNLPPLDDKQVQDLFMSLNEDIEDLIKRNLVQTEENAEDRSSEYTKDELFEMYETINAKVEKLKELQKLLQKVHFQRISALQKVYRKNFMKKLKEAQAAAEKAKAEEEVATEAETETEQEIVEEEAQETKATEKDELPERDEL